MKRLAPRVRVSNISVQHHRARTGVTLVCLAGTVTALRRTCLR
jgi:hypothetical protein